MTPRCCVRLTGVARQRLQQLPALRTRVEPGQRARPRAVFGDSACSTPATVYYDAVQFVHSDDDDDGGLAARARPRQPPCRAFLQSCTACAVDWRALPTKLASPVC